MAAPVIQFKRGQFANLPGLRPGEPGFTTDKYDLFVGIDSTTSNNKFFGSHRYWTKETTTAGSGLRLVEGTDNGENYIELKAPASVASNLTYTFPASITAGGYLLVDSNGDLSWDDTLDATNVNATGVGTVAFLQATTVNVSAGVTVSGALDVNGGADFSGNGITATEVNASGVVTATTFDGNLATTNLTGTITNAQLGGSIANGKLANSSVSLGGVSVSLGGSDDTPAFDLSDATDLPTTSLTGTITNAQLAGSIADSKLNTISTANKVEIGALDIDGGTDIGADLADADLFIVDDGAGGTNRKAAMSRVKDYVLGGGTGANFAAINVSGIATVTFADATTLKVGAGATITGALNVDGGADISGGETTMSSATVSDLTSGRVVLAGSSGALGDSTQLTFNTGNGLRVTNDINASGIVSATTFDGNLATSNLTGVITNGQLDGNIADSKLAENYVKTSEVDDSSIEFSGGTLNVKAAGVTNAMLAGSIANGKLDEITTADKVNVSAINIDGATDIGADLADADLIVVDDGAGGTNRKATMTRVKDYVLGGGAGANFVNLQATGITTTNQLGTTDIVVSAGATVTGALDVDGGANIASGLTVTGGATVGGAADFNGGVTANTLIVEDLTDNRVVIAGSGGELEDSGNLTFDGSSLGVTGTVVASSTVTASAFHTGAEGSAIRVTSNTISGPATLTLDPAGVGDNSGTVVIAGDLQVDGTTTTINSTTVNIDDKNIQIATGAANDAAADGAGITVDSGEGDKTFQFEATGDNFGSSENINLASGKVLKVNNTEVLSGSALASAIAVDVASLNIDGATDIGADLVDADLLVVDDGAGGTNRKTAMSRVKDYVLGGGAGANFEQINVSGIATVTFADATTLKVGAGATVTGALDVDGGANIAGGLTANSAIVSDLTDGRVVLAGSGGELEDSAALSFSGGTLSATTFSGSGASLTDIPNAALDNSSVSFGGVSVALGAADATPAFNLADATGLPISSGVAGLGANVATFLGTPSSANLAAAITDETGTSTLVFSESPTVNDATLTGDITAGRIGATNVNAAGIVTASSFVGANIRQTNGTLIPLVGVTTASGHSGLVTAFKFDGTGLEDFSVIDGTATVTVSGVAATTFTTSQTITATEGQTALTFDAGYTQGFVDVYLNGVRLVTGVDYNDNVDKSTVTLASGATAGDEVEIVAWKSLGDVAHVQSLKTVSDLTVGGIATATTFNGQLNTTGIATAATFVGALTGNADTATALATARNIGGVSFDGTANINLPGVNQSGTQDTSGNAATATVLETSRTLAIAGDATGSASFNGGANATITATLANSGVSAGTVGSSSAIPIITVDAKGRVTATSTATVVTTLTVDGDSGSEDIALASEDLTISGGSNVTTTAASNGVEVALDDAISLTSVTASGAVQGATVVATTSATLASAKVSDLTSGRVVTAGADGELQDASTLTYDGTTLSAPALSLSGNAVVGGNLTVNGTLTSINTTNTTIEDTLLELQRSSSGNLGSDTNKDVGLVMNYYDGSAKKAAFFWDDSAGRFVFASESAENTGVLTPSAYAGLEVGSLYVNDCAGASQVISCSGTTRSLENITIDGGSF